MATRARTLSPAIRRKTGAVFIRAVLLGAKMDPISLAIVSALANLSERAIQDAYNAVKGIIVRKFGSGSDLSKAVDNVEQKPDSIGRQEMLKEEIIAAKANQDPELLKAAETLIAKIKELPGGQTIITQTVSGDKNIFSGTGNVTVTDKS